jgi:hypothetical protein
VIPVSDPTPGRGDWTHSPRIYTPAEVTDAVLTHFQPFRDDLRARASEATGPEQARLREAMVEVTARFNDLEDTLLERFGQPVRPPWPPVRHRGPA